MDHAWLREAEAEYDIPDNKHDKGYKYLLSVKKVFIELLKSFVKQGWVDNIEESNIYKIDKSFILQDFKDKEADLVYWVKLNDQDVIFYILTEMQSTVDFQMPYRLLLYMVEIWRGVLKDLDKSQEKKKDFRLPAIVPIVLYNGENNWTACRRYKEYLSGHELFGENIIDFKYILIDINRYKEEELLEMSNLIASVFLIDQKRDTASIFNGLEKVLATLKNIDTREFGLFKGWFMNIIARGIDSDSYNYNMFREIILHSKEGESMVYNLERMWKEELNRSKEQGIKLGKVEGKAEGKAEGKIEGKIEVAYKLSELGFDINTIVKATGLSEEEIKELTGRH